jgi:hypothetical protein
MLQLHAGYNQCNKYQLFTVYYSSWEGKIILLLCTTLKIIISYSLGTKIICIKLRIGQILMLSNRFRFLTFAVLRYCFKYYYLNYIIKTSQGIITNKIALKLQIGGQIYYLFC